MSGRIEKFRTKLLLSSAIAMLPFAYGGRVAHAGVCAPVGGGVYSCSGALNAATDLTNGGLTDPLNPGTPLSITTDPGFGIDTSTNGGSAFDLVGTGGLSFTDNHISTIIGGNNGIYADNGGSGAISVTSTGTVTGTGNDGVYAYNGASGTDLSISVNNATGANNGVYANNYGTGATTVTATGTVTGSGADGVSAYNAGTSLSVSVNNVSGAYNGVTARNGGSGATSVSVAAGGTVTGAAYDGVYAASAPFGASTTLDVTTGAGSTVTGYYAGIVALNGGTGALTVNAQGTVTGQYDTGIVAINTPNGTDVSVTANTVNGYGDGVAAINNGSGALSVTTTGQVTATNGDGIYAANNYGTNLTINATGGVSGGDDGISVDNYGTGATSVTATGTVTGTSDDGIEVYNYDSTTNLTISAQNVTAGDSGVKADNLGSGFVDVTVTGNVIAGDEGIEAYNSSNGTSMTVTANNVDASAGETAIRAVNYGSGPTTVSVSGTVTGGLLDFYGGPAFGIQTVTGAGGNTTVNLNAGADVSALSGVAIVNDDGNSSVNVNAGASVTGAIRLGGGTDALTFDGGNFAGVTEFNGGAGSGDSLTFRNTGGNVAGSTVVGMESVVVGTGATINASGTLTTGELKVESGGTLGAGTSPGLLQVLGDAGFLGGSTLAVELGGLIFGSGYDRIDVADDSATTATEGIATLADGTMLDIDYFGAFTAGLGDTFDILVADDIVVTLSGLLFDFSGAVLGSGLSWQTAIVDFGGGREALRLSVVSDQIAEVSEPGATLLLTAGVLGLVGLRRRRGARVRMAA